MYRNQVYTFCLDKDIHKEDLSVPIKIVNCGHYIVKTVPVADTYVPAGSRMDYQLLYVSSGKAYFYFDSEKTTVEKGYMVIYRPGELQKYEYHSVDKTEVFWIHFTGFEVESYLEKYKIPKNEHVFFAGTSMDYSWIFRQIIIEMQHGRVNFEIIANNLFTNILIMINRYIIEGNQIELQMISEIEKAVHYFNDNYRSKISVEDYAKKSHMSVNWFIHCFKTVMKVTPMQYISSLRMECTKAYLKDTDKPVSEISAIVGYNNPLYFSRIFKKNTGMSPSEYRKDNRSLNNE